MPANNQKTLSAARAESNTPRVPANFWERLDEQTAEMHRVPPEESFTIAEYASRYGITHSVAHRQLEHLAQKGIVEEVGTFGCRHARYFILVNK